MEKKNKTKLLTSPVKCAFIVIQRPSSSLRQERNKPLFEGLLALGTQVSTGQLVAQGEHHTSPPPKPAGGGAAGWRRVRGHQVL